MGNNAKIDTLLVLSGVNNEKDVYKYNIFPTYVSKVLNI